MAAILGQPERKALGPVAAELLERLAVAVDVDVRVVGIERLPHDRSLAERVVAPQATSLERDVLPHETAQLLELGMDGGISTEDADHAEVALQRLQRLLKLID